jgi:hypothetical protein
MRNILLCAAGVCLVLSGCSPGDQASGVAIGQATLAAVGANTPVRGQLFCKAVNPVGETVIEALADAAGVPVIVSGMAVDAVNTLCGGVNGKPVAPPADTSTVVVQSVVIPAGVVVGTPAAPLAPINLPVS